MDSGVGWAFTAVGAVMTGVALLLLWRSMRLLRLGGNATGIVVDNEERMSTGGRGAPRKYHHPVVAFTTPKGEKIRFTSSVGRLPVWPKGTELRVLFDPVRPGDAEVATFASLWFFPLVTALFSLPFLLFGLSALF